MAGPRAVPAAKAAITGAMVLFLLLGVEMSVIARVAEVDRAATPKPTVSLQSTSWSLGGVSVETRKKINSKAARGKGMKKNGAATHKPPAKPMPAVPAPMASRE